MLSDGFKSYFKSCMKFPKLTEPMYKYGQQDQVTKKSQQKYRLGTVSIKILGSLNRFYGYHSKVLGPDKLHSRFLKDLATELGCVFVHLFQKSLDTGEISKEWSVANICPLYEKGDRALAFNYHPVSLTCVPCKLLEHIVCSNIMAIWLNINFSQIDNMHLEKGTVVKLS